MRKYSVRGLATALVGAGICVASAVNAADLGGGSFKDDPYVAPPSTWTGFYIGANAGWARSDFDVTHSVTGAWLGPAGFPADNAAINALGSVSLSGSRFTGGGQAGYNWQSGTWLFGVETDINALNASETSSGSTTLPVAGTGVTTTTKVEADWYGTLRARLGFTSGNLLFYGTGGLAYGKHSVSQSVSFAGSGTTATGGASDTKTGWALGGGLEWALDRNWTFRGEYMRVDLGSVNATLVNATFPIPGFTHQVESDLKLDVIRAGLNYKF